MAAGLGLLALPPDTFWRMTLPELDAAIRGRLGTASPEAMPSRGEMAALMQRYPDIPE